MKWSVHPLLNLYIRTFCQHTFTIFNGFIVLKRKGISTTKKKLKTWLIIWWSKLLNLKKLSNFFVFTAWQLKTQPSFPFLVDVRTLGIDCNTPTLYIVTNLDCMFVLSSCWKTYQRSIFSILFEGDRFSFKIWWHMTIQWLLTLWC